MLKYPVLQQHMFTGYKNFIVFNSPFSIVLRPEAVKAKGVVA